MLARARKSRAVRPRNTAGVPSTTGADKSRTLRSRTSESIVCSVSSSIDMRSRRFPGGASNSARARDSSSTSGPSGPVGRTEPSNRTRPIGGERLQHDVCRHRLLRSRHATRGLPDERHARLPMGAASGAKPRPDEGTDVAGRLEHHRRARPQQRRPHLVVRRDGPIALPRAHGHARLLDAHLHVVKFAVSPRRLVAQQVVRARIGCDRTHRLDQIGDVHDELAVGGRRQRPQDIGLGRRRRRERQLAPRRGSTA